MNSAPHPFEPVALTLSALEPMGGAGILADLKTFAAHGCYGVAAITAIHPENFGGAPQQIHPVGGQVVKGCIQSAFSNTRVKAIKIGMLATAANAAIALEMLEENSSLPVVLDPVVRSAAGQELIDDAGLKCVCERLLPCATVITPNLVEAAALTGLRVENLEGMKAAAQQLIRMGAQAVVVTGGHLERPVDVFAQRSTVQSLAGDPVKPQNIYGAACAFSSALAANLAHGRELSEAIVLAKAFVTEAIKKARPVGPGRVPLHHLYRVQEAQRSAESPAAATSR